MSRFLCMRCATPLAPDAAYIDALCVKCRTPPAQIVCDGHTFDAVLVQRATDSRGNRGIVAVSMKNATPQNVAAALMAALMAWFQEKIGPLTPENSLLLAGMLSEEMKKMAPTVRPPEALPRS